MTFWDLFWSFSPLQPFFEKKNVLFGFLSQKNDFLGPFLVFFASAAFFWKKMSFLVFYLRKMTFGTFFGLFGFFQKNDFWGFFVFFFQRKKTLGPPVLQVFVFCSEKRLATRLWIIFCEKFIC